ncbi:MAG TPA: hypothetical protein VMU81_11190 [Acetobacteraceae bacterium]|nr:hypothetical protein [Acetobacteraceae bacterium]
MAGGSTNETGPTLQLPSYEQVVSDGTVAVTGASYSDSFAASNPGAMYLGISDSSGLLYGFDPAGGTPAPGSGTDSIMFQGSYAGIEAIINSLTYVATGSTTIDQIQYDIWNQAGVQTTGDVPVTIGGTVASTGTGTPPATPASPAITEPAGETIAAGATLSVSGSYADSFAAGNAGALYLGITGSSGTLHATNTAGQAVAGSGTDSIALTADYADVNAVLKSLTYTAASATGSDSINFDIWNQAGVETTDTVPVTITAGGGGLTSETWTGAVSSDWNTAANWSGGAVPASGDSVTIPGTTTNIPTLSNATLNGETITLSGGTVDFNNVTLDSSLSASGSGAIQIGGTLTTGSTGSVIAGSGTQLDLEGSVETIINNGTLASAGGLLDIYNNATATSASATLVNAGTIVADGGTVNIASNAHFTLPGSLPDWSIADTGGAGIGDSGNLLIDGTVAGGNIAFTGTGALALEQSNALAGGAMVTDFGPGEKLDLYGAAGDGGTMNFANGTLDVATNGTLAQAIVLGGSFTTGNFEQNVVGGPGNPGEIVYVPGGGISGMFDPEIATPATATVAQGTTLALNDVSIENLGTQGGTAVITAQSGTLYMNGATGSGTHQLTLSSNSTSQMEADLASLAYVPAAGASTDTVTFQVSPSAPVSTIRAIPITIDGGSSSSGPALQEPSSETVASGRTVAVAGSYSDSFAAGNPGHLFLAISDSTGTLTATNAAGQAVAGSGTNNLAVSTDYVDVNAILASLHYTAGTGSGSDTISFDIWNQAGVETTGAAAVTIDPAAQSMSLADFTTGSASSLTPQPAGSTGSAGTMLLADRPSHPIGIPSHMG